MSANRPPGPFSSSGPAGSAGNDFDDADMKTVVGTSQNWSNDPKPNNPGEFDDEGAKTVVASEDQLRAPAPPPPRSPASPAGVGVAKPLSKVTPPPRPAVNPPKNEFDEEGLRTVVASEDQLSAMPPPRSTTGSGFGTPPAPAKPPARSEFAENELKTMVATEEQLSSGPMPALLGVAPAKSVSASQAFAPAPMHTPGPAMPPNNPGVREFAADKVQETLVVPDGYSQSLYQQLPKPNQPGAGPPGMGGPNAPMGPPGMPTGPGPGHLGPGPYVQPGHIPGALPQPRPGPTLGYVLLGLAGLCIMGGVSTMMILKMPYGLLSAIMCLGGALVCGGLGFQKIQLAKG